MRGRIEGRVRVVLSVPRDALHNPAVTHAEEVSTRQQTLDGERLGRLRRIHLGNRQPQRRRGVGRVAIDSKRRLEAGHGHARRQHLAHASTNHAGPVERHQQVGDVLIADRERLPRPEHRLSGAHGCRGIADVPRRDGHVTGARHTAHDPEREAGEILGGRRGKRAGHPRGLEHVGAFRYVRQSEAPVGPDRTLRHIPAEGQILCAWRHEPHGQIGQCLRRPVEPARYRCSRRRPQGHVHAVSFVAGTEINRRRVVDEPHAGKERGRVGEMAAVGRRRRHGEVLEVSLPHLPRRIAGRRVRERVCARDFDKVLPVRKVREAILATVVGRGQPAGHQVVVSSDSRPGERPHPRAHDRLASFVPHGSADHSRPPQRKLQVRRPLVVAQNDVAVRHRDVEPRAVLQVPRFRGAHDNRAARG